jgi:hypothetical protein
MTELHPAGLEQAARGSVVLHHVPGSQDRGDCLRGRRVKAGLVEPAFGAETPQVDQRAGTRIVGAAGVKRHLQRVVDDSGKLSRQGLPGAGGGAIEPAQVGGGFPMTHLGHDLVEFTLQVGQWRIVDHLGRPGRAHREAGRVLHHAAETRRRGVDGEGDENALQKDAYSGSTARVAV